MANPLSPLLFQLLQNPDPELTDPLRLTPLTFCVQGASPTAQLR